ncbi:MAG TPA: thioredoxin domain-containing protein [Ktedonobacterales bacterium]
MNDIVLRIGVLALLSLAVWGAVWVGRRYVEEQRRRALAAAPAAEGAFERTRSDGAVDSVRVRILAFSSDDCVQCHRLQAPALRRVIEARGDAVAVVDVDAPSEPDLTGRYHVLTVPTTVVLDVSGRARAVNYGFANVQKLLDQVDEALIGADGDATHVPGGVASN